VYSMYSMSREYSNLYTVQFLRSPFPFPVCSPHVFKEIPSPFV
jgi:hypothetical protein